MAVSVVVAGAHAATPPRPARFDDPFAYCAAVGTIDAPDARYMGPPVPEVVARELQKAFDVPANQSLEPFMKNSVWRCMQGRVYACNVGANLPCKAKANTSHTPTRAMIGYCQEEPDADFIPAYVTGRETIYEWHCRGAVPQVGHEYTKPDARGFLTIIWHEIPPP